MCPSAACHTAGVPWVLWQPTQAPTLGTESARESNLMPCVLISQVKEQGTSFYRVLMNGAVLAVRLASRSHLRHSCWCGACSCSHYRSLLAGLIPSCQGETTPQHPTIHICLHREVASDLWGIAGQGAPLLPWSMRLSNAKQCHLLQDFRVFPTLHSSFVHLPLQHWQTTKGNLQPH